MKFTEANITDLAKKMYYQTVRFNPKHRLKSVREISPYILILKLIHVLLYLVFKASP